MSNPPLNPAQTDPLAQTDADGNPLRDLQFTLIDEFSHRRSR